jgi:hypothetical protein
MELFILVELEVLELMLTALVVVVQELQPMVQVHLERQVAQVV